MKEPIISYDWKHELWHLIVEDRSSVLTSTASCHVKNKYPQKSHIDWNPGYRPLAFGIPYTFPLLGHVNKEDIKFGFDYICKKCLRLEKINIEEFKFWLIVRKLKG